MLSHSPVKPLAFAQRSALRIRRSRSSSFSLLR
nr:MAG TPA: hypothetical protein [Caudoviricetes sp.]